MAALPAAAREAEDLGLRTVDPRRSADLSIHRGPGVHERGHDGEGPISEGLLGKLRCRTVDVLAGAALWFLIGNS